MSYIYEQLNKSQHFLKMSLLEINNLYNTKAQYVYVVKEITELEVLNKKPPIDDTA